MPSIFFCQIHYLSNLGRFVSVIQTGHEQMKIFVKVTKSNLSKIHVTIEIKIFKMSRAFWFYSDENSRRVCLTL